MTQSCNSLKCHLREVERNLTELSHKRKIELLNSKIDFLRFCDSPPPFSDVVLVASDEVAINPPSVPAHKAVLGAETTRAQSGRQRRTPLFLRLTPKFSSSYHIQRSLGLLASRSPVFKAMLESEMEESRSGTIKISDVSYDVLLSFVNYMYTGDACLDEQMACDLLILADKYDVNHLKTTCEKFLVSKLKMDNAVTSLKLAHQHNAKHLQESALSILTADMNRLIKTEEYACLVEKDPRLVVKIYEAYLSKQVKAATKSN